MNARLSSVASLTLHIALLAMVSLVGWRTHEIISAPTGMAIEIVDLEYAMPLPEPHLARAEDTQTETVKETQEADSPAVTMAEAVPARVAIAPSARPQTDTNATPVRQPESLPDNRPSAEGNAMPELAPVPVVRPVVPTARPSLSPGAEVVQEQASAAPTPAPRRLNAAALSRSLASRTGQAPRSRLNSSVIGSLIGEAVPKGVAGLTMRQRANLVDMIRSQITPCWNPPLKDDAGGNVTVVMRIRLDRAGAVTGTPAISRINGRTATNAAYANALAGSVRRAVLRCSPLELPSELYDAWANIELNFDPKDVT